METSSFCCTHFMAGKTPTPSSSVLTQWCPYRRASHTIALALETCKKRSEEPRPFRKLMMFGLYTQSLYAMVCTVHPASDLTDDSDLDG